MSEPAIKADVIAALSEATGVSVVSLNDGSIEIAAVGQPMRRYAFKATVPRRLLWRFVGWYEVPIEAFPTGLSRRPMPQANNARSVFSDLLRRLVRVPKHEIDDQERKYQREREALKHHPKTPTRTPRVASSLARSVRARAART